MWVMITALASEMNITKLKGPIDTIALKYWKLNFKDNKLKLSQVTFSIC